MIGTFTIGSDRNGFGYGIEFLLAVVDIGNGESIGYGCAPSNGRFQDADIRSVRSNRIGRKAIGGDRGVVVETGDGEIDNISDGIRLAIGYTINKTIGSLRPSRQGIKASGSVCAGASRIKTDCPICRTRSYRESKNIIVRITCESGKI